MLNGAARVLAVGIGGGGDVVGALAVAELAGRLGADAVVGGITWERRPIDPVPGPRRLDEITGAELVAPCVALASPATVGPHGVPFAESHMAAHLGERTVLVDPNPAPRAVGEGLARAARALGCDLVVLVDVGGDVLAHGDEPGLASPLADALLLAAAPAVRDAGLPVLAGLFGAGCDGELRPAEVLERVAEVAAHGGNRGAWGLDAAGAEALEAAVARVPTEASAMAVRCARGATGTATIRDGRRSVELSPLGALLFLFDPFAALASAARLADAVLDADGLEQGNGILHRLGVRTELDLEREAAQADRDGR